MNLSEIKDANNNSLQGLVDVLVERCEGNGLLFVAVFVRKATEEISVITNSEIKNIPAALIAIADSIGKEHKGARKK